MRREHNRRGFTMAELLIVVAIIAVLVAVAIPVFNTQIEKSRQAVDLTNLRGAYSAARIAAITGEVADGEPIAPGFYYWYDPASGSLLGANKETVYSVEDGMVDGYMKADKGKVLVDISGLPEYIQNDYKDLIEQYDGVKGAIIELTFDENYEIDEFYIQKRPD